MITKKEIINAVAAICLQIPPENWNVISREYSGTKEEKMRAYATHLVNDKIEQYIQKNMKNVPLFRFSAGSKMSGILPPDLGNCQMCLVGEEKIGRSKIEDSLLYEDYFRTYLTEYGQVIITREYIYCTEGEDIDHNFVVRKVCIPTGTYDHASLSRLIPLYR